MTNFPLPRATSLNAKRVLDYRQHVNLGLLYQRYMPWDAGNKTLAAEFLKDVKKAAENVDEKSHNAFVARWHSVAHDFDAEVSDELQTDGRFLTGIGINNRTEVGFLFSRYGTPYLPGSGCKGLARAFALGEIAQKYPNKGIEEWEKEFSSLAGQETEQNRDKKFSKEVQGAFRVVFGNQQMAGKAIFFDGIPEKPPKLDVDVMTPHFGEYYTGSKLPLDSLTPTPIHFLTVAPKQKFLFAVGWRGGKNDIDYPCIKIAMKWLEGGLTELGAGAKTNAGYGYFNYV